MNTTRPLRRSVRAGLCAAALVLFTACRVTPPAPATPVAPNPAPAPDTPVAAPLPRPPFLQAFADRLPVAEKQIPAILRSAEVAAQRFVPNTNALITVPYGDQPSFAEELLNRSGGLAIALPLEDRPRRNRPTPQDLFLFSVRSWEQDAPRARRQLTTAASNGWYIVLFASAAGRPADIPADVLIDNGAATPAESEAPLNALVNVLNAWLWQSEFVAACSRRGEAPALLMSIYRPESAAHNEPIQRDRLQRVPCPTPIPAGELARLYLDRVRRLIDEINRDPVRGQLDRAIALLRAHREAGRTPALSTCSHFTLNEIDRNNRSTWKPLNAVWRASTVFTNQLGRGDLLVWLGYIGISTPNEDYGKFIRASGTDFITCFVPDLDPAKNAPEAKAHIDQSWAFGDAEVPLPFPPGRMAPVSGLNVGLLHRLLDADGR